MNQDDKKHLMDNLGWLIGNGLVICSIAVILACAVKLFIFILRY